MFPSAFGGYEGAAGGLAPAWRESPHGAVCSGALRGRRSCMAGRLLGRGYLSSGAGPILDVATNLRASAPFLVRSTLSGDPGNFFLLGISATCVRRDRN